MIGVEGRVLAGLDEFMLRTGHLVAMINIAHLSGSSWRRIERETAELLIAQVAVDEEMNTSVAQYLAEKELCALERGGKASSRKEFRYPKLEVYEKADGSLQVRSVDGAVPYVCWQDRNLSHPSVPSKVGAVTADAKFGSKTGLSHIADWCQLLDFIAPNGQLRPAGRLLCGHGEAQSELLSWNPYLLGAERLLIAKEYISRDFDIFRRLAVRFVAESQPLSRSACRDLFVAALVDVVNDSQKSPATTSRQRFELQQHLRDLERAAKKADVTLEHTSTAWHRTASRVETLVDIGLLEKGNGGEREKYQYVYYASERLRHAVEALSTAKDSGSWIDQHLMEVLFGEPGLASCAKLSSQELVEDLAEVIRALSLPTSLLPIDTLVVGIGIRRAARGSAVCALGEIRRRVEALPEIDSELARLSRGRTGSAADFISINLRRLSEIASGK